MNSNADRLSIMPGICVDFRIEKLGSKTGSKGGVLNLDLEPSFGRGSKTGSDWVQTGSTIKLRPVNIGVLRGSNLNPRPKGGTFFPPYRVREPRFLVLY